MENDTSYLWVIFALLTILNLDYVLTWIGYALMGMVLAGLALCFLPAIWAMPIPAAILFIFWMFNYYEEKAQQHD